MKYGQNNKIVKMYETIFLSKFYGHIFTFLKDIWFYRIKEKEGTRKNKQKEK